MKGKGVLLIIGTLLLILKWRKLIAVNNWWIALCFFLWFILFYISVHQKNKDRKTPRPVYITGG